VDLTLTHQRLPGVTVIGICGELDLLSAGPMEEHLQRLWHPGDQLIIDLANTTFIDCSGLGALMRIHRHVHQGGGLVRLAAPQPLPAKIIRLTEVDAVMAVHPSLRNAIGAAFNHEDRQTSRPLTGAIFPARTEPTRDGIRD
jgi:anti-sigma B factor antagonist